MSVSVALKSIVPELAGILGVTGCQIYERQRVLVRGGVLVARPGRGRGSGVLLTPANVSTLLLTMLIAGGKGHVCRSDVAEDVSVLRAAPIAGDTLLSNGHRRSCGELLAEILTGRVEAPDKISVSQFSPSATFEWAGRMCRAAADSSCVPTPFDVIATIGREAIGEMCSLVLRRCEPGAIGVPLAKAIATSK